MSKYLIAIAALVLGIITGFFIDSALAQTVADPATGVVVIPWGEYVSTILTWVISIAGTIAAAVVAWLAKTLGERWSTITKIAQVDQLLKRALEYAANTTAGVVKDKKVEVKVANEFLRNAIQYAVDSAPAWLMVFMGGPAGVRAKLIARADFEAGASDVTLKPPEPTSEAKKAVTASIVDPIT